jgi:protein-tyrosine phosphatase
LQYQIEELSSHGQLSGGSIGIGIHCTHGINRTGFNIVNFLMSSRTMYKVKSLRHAIQTFNESRHPYSLNDTQMIEWLENKYQGQEEVESEDDSLSQLSSEMKNHSEPETEEETPSDLK